jgi:hypothetical protein
MHEERGAGQPPKMDRRNFLRLGGAGLAGAVFLSRAGGSALAQSTPSVRRDFGAAAEKYGVPVELLLAMGYVNTMWEMPAPSPYDPEDLHGSGAYGILQLRRTPSEDTLGRAASLTGLTTKKLKTDRASNILGGTAVLEEMADGNKPSDLNGWYEIVADYEGSPGYANEVYGVLEDGAIKETLGGERVSLSSQPEAETQPIFTAQASGDAPGSTWYGNNDGQNRTNASRGAAQIDKIVVHVGQGDYWSIIDWFRHPDNTGSSAHYTVSKQGAVGQSVKEEDIAWHAGWWKTNKASIGIEHAGYINDSSWFTEDMYRASARLAAYLSRRYGIPLDRRHIIGHHEVPGCSGRGGGVHCHTDPGNNWKWGKYMDLVKRYRRRM